MKMKRGKSSAEVTNLANQTEKTLPSSTLRCIFRVSSGSPRGAARDRTGGRTAREKLAQTGPAVRARKQLRSVKLSMNCCTFSERRSCFGSNTISYTSTQHLRCLAIALAKPKLPENKSSTPCRFRDCLRSVKDHSRGKQKCSRGNPAIAALAC